MEINNLHCLKESRFPKGKFGFIMAGMKILDGN